MRASALFVGLFSATALAHMEMIDPFPFRSKHNPDNSGKPVDYSMTSPLKASGKHPPCSCDILNQESVLNLNSCRLQLPLQGLPPGRCRAHR